MAYNPALNHQALVAAVRSRFDNVPPSVDRAGQIVNAVALELIKAGEVDAGLLYKAGGTNWRERSIDIIVYRDGPPAALAFHCLRDAEGAAAPQWANAGGTPDPSRWRAPYGSSPEPPTPPPSDLEARVTRLERIVEDHEGRFRVIADGAAGR